MFVGSYMPVDTYMGSFPCHVRIRNEGEVLELPTEEDGKLLLSTITGHFQDAIGLRFKTATGAWTGIRVMDGVLQPPIEGWGQREYFITRTVSVAMAGKG